MKKILVVFYLFLVYRSPSVLAHAEQELQIRLAKLNSFHTHFSQTITSNDGTIVQQGEGEVWIKRPNLFNWHMTSPDESLLISDGQTLWFYSPFVQQATATWLKSAIGKTPFMLITCNDLNYWKQYEVKQKGDNFELTPKSITGQWRKFTINVTNNGYIHNFSAIEQNGSRSTYFMLKIQNKTSMDTNKFIFIPPHGVTVDDQRQ